jgi:hypothetical protein
MPDRSLVAVADTAADKQFMSLEELLPPLAHGEDFGLAGHLAAIDSMHREALAQLDALAQPWGNLWSSGLALVTGETEEQRAIDESEVRGAHAAAA